MSEKPALTNVQRQAAVERLADNVALCSGAGCGKTFVLARRFTELLRAHKDAADPLPEFVALTFTEKAALEMSQRVRRTLGEFAAAASGEDRRCFRQWLESVSEARISTIHGFCAALLRAWAVEAGLDPAFTVCGEDDLVVRKLFADAAEQVVLDTVEGRWPAAPTGRSAERRAPAEVSAFQEGVAELVDRAGLAKVVDQVHMLAGMRLECDLADYLDPAATFVGWKRRVSAVQRELWTAACRDGGLAGALEELDRLPCNDESDKLAQARAALVATLRPALQPGALPTEALFEAAAQVKLNAGSAGAWGGKQGRDEAKRVLGHLRDRLKGLAACGLEVGEADRKAAEELALLARLAQEVRRRYDRQKRNRGILDFTDLLEHTGRLLRNDAVAASVRAGIRQLLLDEAQDTDAFQIRMIERMLFGDAKGEPAEGRLFLVGDPKQSIYRFRGARVEVFADLCRRLGKDNQLYLDVSFRSHRQLVGFVNHLFGRLMGNDYARIEAHRQDAPPQPSVEFLLASPEGEEFASAGDAARAQASVAARRVADLVQKGERLVWDEAKRQWRPARYGDVAILFSRMTDSLQYERELADRDVPYYVVAGSGFFQQQEVLDVLNALAAIDNPFDDVALFGALRSSLFGLDDEALLRVARACEPPYFEKLSAPAVLEQFLDGPRGALRFAIGLLAGLHRRKDAAPIDRLIEELLDRTGYEAVLLCQPNGRRMAGNVRRLCELSRPGAAGPVTLAEFLSQMREHVLDESRYEQAAVVAEAEDVVRLMTIHKAKGLEFPLVVLPDLCVGRRGVTDALLHRPDLGLTYKPAEGISDGGNDVEDEEEVPASYALAQAAENEDLRRENVRRLYVGATRAQDHLVFVGADWRNEKTERLRESGSHLEMLDSALSLAARADGDGRLAYEDAGQSYVAVVRKTPPVPPPAGSRTKTRGQKLLAAAKGSGDVARSLLSAAGKGDTPPLVGPLPPTVASVELAVTALNDFEHCPMLYRWRYELGAPSRPRQGRPARQTVRVDPPAAALDAAQLGTLFHRCMELLDFARPQTAAQLIALAADDLETPAEISRDGLAGEFQPMLEKFLAHPLGRQIAGAPSRLAELDFQFRQGPLRLGGKIDLLWRDAGGGWHIVDYKSDRAAGADLAEYARRYELQMAAYALAASRHLGAPVADATLFFLRRGEAQLLRPEGRELDAQAKRIAEIAERLIAARRSGDFPRCRSADCGYCPYRAYCEAAAPAAGRTIA